MFGHTKPEWLSYDISIRVLDEQLRSLNINPREQLGRKSRQNHGEFQNMVALEQVFVNNLF